MKHTSITIPDEFAEDQQAVIDHIARKLTIGARRAMLSITDQWQTAKDGKFSSSGARFLWWQYQDLNLCERQQGRIKETVAREYDHYRLTPLGLRVKKSLVMQGIT